MREPRDGLATLDQLEKAEACFQQTVNRKWKPCIGPPRLTEAPTYKEEQRA
jgi:hypothetical protein